MSSRLPIGVATRYSVPFVICRRVCVLPSALCVLRA
jgi:hypothetical protein